MVDEKGPSQIELSSEDIKLLEGIREEFLSLLLDYKDAIPPDVMSGPCIYKCQNGWFAMASGRLSAFSRNLPSKLEESSLHSSIKKATRFIDAYAKRNITVRKSGEIYLATPQNIKNANTVIEKIIKEIDNILSQE